MSDWAHHIHHCHCHWLTTGVISHYERPKRASLPAPEISTGLRTEWQPAYCALCPVLYTSTPVRRPVGGGQGGLSAPSRHISPQFCRCLAVWVWTNHFQSNKNISINMLPYPIKYSIIVLVFFWFLLHNICIFHWRFFFFKEDFLWQGLNYNTGTWYIQHLFSFLSQ